MNRTTSHDLFKKSLQYIPGGVNSPVRAFQAIGGTPVFIKKAEGAFLYDEDGNKYLDLINSWGPMILGHAHPEVVEAVRKACNDSFSFGTVTRKELEIAQLIVNHIDHIEQIRFVNSGTEACMSAIRLARGYTNRDYIIKFRGCYHGHADSFLVAAGSGAQTLNQPDSKGVPVEFVQKTLLADFNNLDSVTSLFDKHQDEIAAVIIEPVMGNMGCLIPEDAFLKEVQNLCNTHGSLFILDEVMTGFRLTFGGAASLFGLDPDLVCYGKIIGGGFPVGAFGGKMDIMRFLAPEGPVYQAGTLSGNPVSISAGLATLNLLLSDPGIYDRIENKTQSMATRLKKLFDDHAIFTRINYCGSMMNLFFTDEPVKDYWTARRTDTELFARFFHGMLDRGIYLPPSNFESWFISAAVEEQHVDKVLLAAGEVVKSIANA